MASVPLTRVSSNFPLGTPFRLVQRKQQDNRPCLSPVAKALQGAALGTRSSNLRPSGTLSALGRKRQPSQASLSEPGRKSASHQQKTKPDPGNQKVEESGFEVPYVRAVLDVMWGSGGTVHSHAPLRDFPPPNLSTQARKPRASAPVARCEVCYLQVARPFEAGIASKESRTFETHQLEVSDPPKPGERLSSSFLRSRF